MSNYTGLVPLPPCDGVIDRRSFLPERARNRRVLHLGCVDEHLTSQRAGTGDLLHEEIMKVADSLIGFDISEPGLDLLRELVPGEYVHGDVERLSRHDFPDVDLVIAAELIEHLGRPAAFFEDLRKLLAQTGSQAILTTPNAYSWSTFVRFAFKGSEYTHPDHRLYYSPATLEETLVRSGLRPVERYSHGWHRSGRSPSAKVLGFLDRLIYARRPWLGIGLVWVVEAD